MSVGLHRKELVSGALAGGRTRLDQPLSSGNILPTFVPWTLIHDSLTMIVKLPLSSVGRVANPPRGDFSDWPNFICRRLFLVTLGPFDVFIFP